MLIRILSGGLVALICQLAAMAPSRAEIENGDVFVHRLLAAIGSRDIEQHRALVDGRSLHCTRGDMAGFYDESFASQTSRKMPAPYRWRTQPISPDASLMFSDAFDYPVRPSHLLQVDFDYGPTSGWALVVHIVRQGRDWHVVIPCPKLATIEASRRAKTERGKQAARVDTLIATMAPGLKSQILKFVREGRKIDAITHYGVAAGEDLSTAKYVVDRLAASAGSN